MKKLFTLCLLILLLRIYPSAQMQTPSVAHHPEKGILPFNAPCKDCEEDLAKRTADTREFFKMEHGSKTIYMQRSLGAMNFKDDNVYWRTIDPVLKQEGEFVFAAKQQPAPVLIDLGNKFASITNAGKEFRFNKNLSLSHVSAGGIVTNLGEGNYSNVSELVNITETTVLVHEFYPGIDLQMISSYGRIETSFILKNKLLYTEGWITLNQQLEIPSGLQSDLSQSAPVGGDRRSGSVLISDLNKKNYFYFKTAHAYDAKESYQNYIDMSFSLQSDKLSYFVPVSWLNDPATIYPVVIDPFVSASDSLPEASIAGSGYSAVCDSFGCSYFINNFNVPGNCEITDVSTYFSYLANLPCIRDDGGFSITMTNPLGASCTSRHYTCLGGTQGACFFWPAFLLNGPYPFSPCLLPPQCASYSLDFEMKFRRCVLPLAGCDATCVLANSPWIMTVTGRTVEMTNVTLSNTICQGGCTNIAASADWGVEPYTFLWTPGNIVGDVISVCPANTTSYLVTVSDACGITDTGSTTISVTNGQSPGFSIFPNDSVCGGTQLTFSANSTDPDSIFSWIINCQTIDTIDSTKIVSYAAPAVPSICTATMLYHVTTGNSTCAFTTIDTFYVMTGSSPSVSLSGPPDSVCQGTVSTYYASANFGGAAPALQWYLNGSVIPGADSSVYAGVFSDGDELVISMTSTDSCSLGVTVWDTIQASVASYIMPTVAIHTIVDTICSGYLENFTMSAHHFGVNPVFLWYLNGVLADSGISFSTIVNYGDEIVAMLISGLACPISDTVTDTSSVIVLPLTSPIVDVTISDDTVCVGDTVIFTSTVSNVAIPPSYRWYLNGNFAGLNSTYSSYSLSSSDVLVLLIFTPNPCGPDSATDTVSIVVNPITSPGVSLIGSDTICSGDTLSLSAAAINGGVTPQFEWYVNGILLGTDSVYSTSSIINGDSLWVTMMSSDECASPDSTADSTIITVVPSVIPAVLISASEDTICFGDQVVFVALPLGAGAAPSYQWMLNSVPIPGATNSTYTTTLPASSILSVLVTSSAACADPEFAEDTITIVVENCLGIDQPSLSVFSLHPNPATDEVVVDFNSSGFSSRNILIYDALGRILYQQMNVSDKNFHIDISAFSPSIYFVKVIEAEKEYLQKLVVE